MPGELQCERVVGDAGPAVRTLPEAFGPTWAQAGKLFGDHTEALLASMENLLRIYRSPESRQYMAGAVESGISEIEAVLRETHPDLDPTQAAAVARFYFALLNGLAVLWITNPDGALPSGEDLATAIGALARQ